MKGGANLSKDLTVDQIAKAIFTVNRHAKAALKPRHLYTIKKEAIHQLLKENKAEKIGLHFSNNPKLSHQHSILLVKVADYYFHLPPRREDFKELEHLGVLDDNYRNPSARMSLSNAKRIIYRYINWKPKKRKPKHQRYSSQYYTPSSLGKMEWPPTRRFH